MRGDAASGAASGVAERCAWRLRRRLSEGLPFRYGKARHAPQRLSHAARALNIIACARAIQPPTACARIPHLHLYRRDYRHHRTAP